MGSVKSLEILKKPTVTTYGRGIQDYSNDYSVFDMGKMPQAIDYKGVALCLSNSYNFQALEKLGISTHFLGLDAPNKMEIVLVRKLWSDLRDKPTHKYSSVNFIVPLEIIDRPYIGETSSARKRVARGDMTWEGFGLDHEPAPDEKIEPTIIDFSTKYESTDRYFNGVSFEERAQKVKKYARLTDERFNEIIKMATTVSNFLTERANKLGMIYLDGKIEVAIDLEERVMLVDEVGTLDSCRFLYKGVHLSKEFLREQYRGSDWHLQLQEAQERGVDPGDYPGPPLLENKYLELASDIYASACNAWTGEKHFPDAPTLDEVVDRHKELV